MGTAENHNKLFMRMTSKVRYIAGIPLNFENSVYSDVLCRDSWFSLNFVLLN